MSERAWMAGVDAQAMVESLRGSGSERKLRLFACARCRSVWPLLADGRSREAVEVAERLADGLASEADRAAAFARATEAASVEDYEDPEDDATYLAAVAAAYARNVVWAEAYVAAHATAPPLVMTDPAAEAVAVGQLRDIFGDPFRRVSIEASWLTWHDGTIPRLAQSIYDDRAFDQLPILADALEDAGCNDADSLNHCRSGGEHVRGCWVVDLLLGKG
jgi:hypothetical protein